MKTLQLDLREKEDFRYLYVLNTHNNGETCRASGFVRDLDLQSLDPDSPPKPSPTPPEQPVLEPGQPYVDLYGHETDVIVGEEIILVLSTVNPITSPGTMSVQLLLRIPSGWSITSSGFGHGAGGLRTNTYEIEQGPNPRTIYVHILPNESYEGDVMGYMDYYFKGEEPRYHNETRLTVTAKSAQTTTEQTSKKGGGLSCSGPTQGVPSASSKGLLLGLGPIYLCWGGLGGFYGVLRWRRRIKKRDNKFTEEEVKDATIRSKHKKNEGGWRR